MSYSNALDNVIERVPFVLTREEARLAIARREIRSIATRYDSLLCKVMGELQSRPSKHKEIVSTVGRSLIARSISDRRELDDLVDDRPLYWARLAARALIRVWAEELPAERKNNLEEALQTLEYSSRKSQSLAQSDKRTSETQDIVLTCFDPFKLDANIGQTNPSAVIALSLDGSSIAGHLVKSLVFPVRYADFDARIVETLCSPHFIDAPRIALTISMGRDQFDLERFPGRRRSAKAPDNTGVLGPISGNPTPCFADSPEFVEFSLPADAMCKVSGSWEVRDNRRVATVELGELTATSLSQLAGLTAVSGSGGGYLSNEISYRTRILQQKLGIEFPLGHLHVPTIEEPEPSILADMVAQTKGMLIAALNAAPSQIA